MQLAPMASMGPAAARTAARVCWSATVVLPLVGIGSGGILPHPLLCAKNTTSEEECALCPLWPPLPPSTVTALTLHQIVAPDPLAPLLGAQVQRPDPVPPPPPG